ERLTRTSSSVTIHGAATLGRTRQRPAATGRTKLTHHKIHPPRLLLELVQFAKIIRHVVVAERNHFLDRLLFRPRRHLYQQLLAPLFKGHGEVAHRSISWTDFRVLQR